MEKYIELINKKLDEYMPINYPNKIFKAMKYTVTLPGKRLRPVMCLECCNMFGGNIEDAVPAACAIEMLHAQTLIHDDLPCVDNDNYRRGQLTNHMVFGEANAVLAGDALLTFAPQIILKYSKQLGAEKLIRIMEEYFRAAGAYGVIAGQVVDIESEKLISEGLRTGGIDVWQSHEEQCSGDSESKLFNDNSYTSIPPHLHTSNDTDFDFYAQTLNYIHTHKTADLFKLALRTGAIIADANEKQLEEITEFGQYMGVAFQIADDILDVTSSFEKMGKTIGKDEQEGKLTYVSLYGLEKAKQDLNSLIDKCFEIFKNNNLKSEIFAQILNKIRIS
ncbi:polyprenyl synthetase family protein [bacterium]|nr:polyprenyl synthetase family protein [bacterium]